MNLFPCPFCHSAAVKVTGAGRHFSHYRCTTCEEVWTAQTPAPSAAFGRAVAHSPLEPDALVGPLAPPTTRKVLLH
jgi:ribosomal protein L37AE/L43A